MRFSFGAAVLLCLVWAPVASAQGVLSGQVGGTITDAAARPLSNAVVTLRSEGSGLTREASSGLDGAFSFRLVPPGSYTLRVEALGYRPLVVTGVAVAVGAYRDLALTLEAAPPPVVEIDTLRFDASESRWTAHGPRLFDDELTAFQDRGGSLAGLSRLSPDLDPQGGALGLPGGFTQHVVDGVPFFRATHPARRGDDLGSPAFPTAFLSGGALGRRSSDAEFLMTPGALIEAETRVGPRGGGDVNAEGAWSGGPLWSSGTLDVGTPTLSSVRTLAEGAVELIPDTSRLYLAGEVLSYETPLERRVPLEWESELSGFDESLRERLLLSSTERVARYSGLARLDRWGPTSRLTIRASGGRLERSYSQATPGWLGYGVALPEETTEMSAAVAYSTAINERYVLEFLSGISLSDRVFGWQEEGDWTPAFLTNTGFPIGPAAGAAAEASRIDGFASTSIQLALGPGDVRGGIAVHAARHTLTNGYAAGGDLAFSDLVGAARGEGAFRSGTPIETTFALPRLAAFAQYTWRPSPGVEILVGGRVDRLNLPTDELRLNEDWLRATGARSDDFPTTFTLPSGHFSATWDLSGTGATVVDAGASIAHGAFDPAVIHEAFSNDGVATVRRAIGPGLNWPASGAPQGARNARVLTLLGPDTRPMRTLTLEGSLTQALGAGWSLHLSATARNTDFIARRRDLNRPTFPAAIDPWDREVVGELRKVGGVVGAVPGVNRRFQDFDAVWAIDPDGWSRYWGATLGLGYDGEVASAFMAYTRSETRDNWLGAASGLPDAQLDPGLPGVVGGQWAEGLSDFDSPNRLVVGARTQIDVGGAEAQLSAVYSRRSGLPFTPGYRMGADANGDGSFRNDVAFVPDADLLGDLLGEWSCLGDQVGTFAERNSCRGPDRSSLDASVRLGLTAVGGRRLWLTVEGFNLIEDQGGLVDRALLRVDPSAPLDRSQGPGRVSIPVSVNPDFGRVVFPATRGRMLRLGLRLGGSP